MSKAAKLTIGIGCTLAAILVALVFFLRSLVVKSFPVTNGSIAVNGIHQPVEIYRDEFGVPHILAKDEHDLMFAVGYVHAQDRLWQMELSRRIGEGRLSEIFDTTTLKFDKMFRTLGFSHLAESLQEHLHPESRRLLEDYSAGVNEFISTHKGKFPIEFDMLNLDPEPWEVKHSLLVARLMAWELNFAWWVDLTYAEIAAKVPPKKFREIIPSWPDSVPAIVPRSKLKASISDVREYLDVVRNYRNTFRVGPFSAGSNAWAVNASKSMTGKPLLANDPHLRVSVPSRWYEIHYSAPGSNVAGVSIPGIPAVVVGHNDSLAWGLTNAMIDDADFYFEQKDSTREDYYRLRNTSVRMLTRDEKIYIGKSDSVEITVRSTLHGPVVNDVHPSRGHSPFDTTIHRTPISMRWTGFDMGDEFYGFYLMNSSRNKSEFELGLKELTVPAQCVVYADVRGNIGFWTAGRVPIRGNYEALLPQAGWTGEAEWRGFIPFDQLPKLLNPPDGMIISANQKITDNSYPYYLSNLWEPPSRFERIRELLTSTEKFTANDFRELQQDVLSGYSRDLTQYILHAFSSDTSKSAAVISALEYLRSWDFRCTSTDVATSIVNEFLVKLLHNTYEDEMGPEVFNDFVYFSAIPYRVTSQLLTADSSEWFDDVTTGKRESRDDIIRKSFLDAIDELRGTVGGEMKTWQWGEIHRVLFEHPFGKQKPLDRVFNVGPFSIGGNATTINKADFPLASPFFFSAGPSMRQVIDLANPRSASSVITLGESGQPLNKHYDDQTALWLNGGYHTVTIDWNEIKRSHWEHLELKQQ